MRVLITGASGLLGSVLVPHLRARGHEVIGCSRRSADVPLDLTDLAQTKATLAELKPEAIINLAALTDVDQCEEKPQLAYLLNVRIVENLASSIKQNGDSCHLIQISTDHVYDGVCPNKERDVRISNYYGISKYAGELVALRVPSTVLRTNFFGRSLSASRTSISDWVIRSVLEGKPITVYEDVCFSPLSLKRVSKMIELVLRNPQQGLFNLGCRGGISKADFAFSLAETMELPTKTMKRGTSKETCFSARRPTGMCMDSTLFEEAFGVTLPTVKEEIEGLKIEYLDATE